MNLVIREYEQDDLADVLRAWETASAIAHPFLTEEFLAQERRNIPELYLPNAETWVAERDGKVIGFIALLGNEVGAIFLNPEFHGQGVGRAMMDKAQELRGSLELDVFKENNVGRNFYAKYGFEIMSESVH